MRKVAGSVLSETLKARDLGLGCRDKGFGFCAFGSGEGVDLTVFGVDSVCSFGRLRILGYIGFSSVLRVPALQLRHRR